MMRPPQPYSMKKPDRGCGRYRRCWCRTSSISFGSMFCPPLIDPGAKIFHRLGRPLQLESWVRVSQSLWLRTHRLSGPSASGVSGTSTRALVRSSSRPCARRIAVSMPARCCANRVPDLISATASGYPCTSVWARFEHVAHNPLDIAAKNAGACRAIGTEGTASEKRHS
jgi:hypothetical protein